MQVHKKEGTSRRIKVEVKKEDKTIAWAFLYLITNERHNEPYGLMENVFVMEQFRGRGIGAQLVKEVIKEAKKQSCYKLIGQARHVNQRAHQLYTEFGFKNHGLNFRMNLLD